MLRRRRAETVELPSQRLLEGPAGRQLDRSRQSAGGIDRKPVGPTLVDVLLGGGLRYFTDPSSPTIAPHNLVISELAEVGIIGRAGMITLLIATFLALRRSRSQLAVLAMMALVLRVTQGMAEIFWVAGPLTIAIILVGMGLTEDPSDEDSSGATTLRERSSRLNWLA